MRSMFPHNHLLLLTHSSPHPNPHPSHLPTAQQPMDLTPLPPTTTTAPLSPMHAPPTPHAVPSVYAGAAVDSLSLPPVSPHGAVLELQPVSELGAMQGGGGVGGGGGVPQTPQVCVGRAIGGWRRGQGIGVGLLGGLDGCTATQLACASLCIPPCFYNLLIYTTLAPFTTLYPTPFIPPPPLHPPCIPPVSPPSPLQPPIGTCTSSWVQVSYPLSTTQAPCMGWCTGICCIHTGNHWLCDHSKHVYTATHVRFCGWMYVFVGGCTFLWVDVHFCGWMLGVAR